MTTGLASDCTTLASDCGVLASICAAAVPATTRVSRGGVWPVIRPLEEPSFDEPGQIEGDLTDADIERIANEAREAIRPPRVPRYTPGLSNALDLSQDDDDAEAILALMTEFRRGR